MCGIAIKENMKMKKLENMKKLADFEAEAVSGGALPAFPEEKPIEKRFGPITPRPLPFP